MIDAESLIYSEIYEKVTMKYPNLYMTGEYVRVPSSFPCVSLVEIDNATFRKSQTTQGRENHVAVTYELNVYSNKTTGKKSQCREITAFIDDLLAELNFTRRILEPVPNQDDPTIYRMFGRYRAVISKDYQIFRR